MDNELSKFSDWDLVNSYITTQLKALQLSQWNEKEHSRQMRAIDNFRDELLRRLNAVEKGTEVGDIQLPVTFRNV